MPSDKHIKTKKTRKCNKKNEKTKETWLIIIIEFCKLRAQGIGIMDALKYLNSTKKYGYINKATFYARYTPWVKARLEERRKEWDNYCQETMESYDIIKRKAFLKEDYRLAKETIRDAHSMGQDIGLYQRKPADRIEIAGPGYFEAVSKTIDEIKKKGKKGGISKRLK